MCYIISIYIHTYTYAYMHISKYIGMQMCIIPYWNKNLKKNLKKSKIPLAYITSNYYIILCECHSTTIRLDALTKQNQLKPKR